MQTKIDHQRTIYTVDSWNSSIVIDGEIYSIDPRLIEDRDAFGYKHMERYARQLTKENGEPLKFIKVKCKDSKGVKIFSN